MTDIVIRAEGVGKSYKIGANQSSNKSFREMLVDAVKGPIRRATNLLQGQAYGATDMTENIWALEDIAFEVKQGEVLGIIGHNGAGKSTLLKILSNITEPTKGYIDVYGRIGALLEVGTGFHEELTGRENIYLNGSILGMGRGSIDSRLDEIIDFSGVERFLDTPVKYYSSGMKLRLGFAVAAHLEPEILVVDEVLAVGDAAFQRKCIGKMQSVAGEGRTVLFVSHNLQAIATLTQRSLLLSGGKIIFDGETQVALKKYLSNNSPSESSVDIRSAERLESNGIALRFNSISLHDQKNNLTRIINEGETFKIAIDFELNTVAKKLEIGCTIRHLETVIPILTSVYETSNITNGKHRIIVNIDPNILRSGTYDFVLRGFIDGKREDFLTPPIDLKINPGSAAAFEKWRTGLIEFAYEWDYQNFGEAYAQS